MSYKFLVLGLLSERPMSGYDIKKHVKTTLGAVTTASYGTLYPTLHKLLAEGSVEMQEIPQQGRPSKKLYFLTEQGRNELMAWLNRPAQADQVRREFLLKLYLARHLGAQQLREMVANRRRETETLLHTLEAGSHSVRTVEEQWIADYALSMCRAEINWLAQFEAQLGSA